MVEYIGILVASLFEGLPAAFPSKKNRAIKKKFKMLRQEKWYKKILDQYGTFMEMNYSVRNFVYQADVENIVKDAEKTKRFKLELEAVLKRERL